MKIELEIESIPLHPYDELARRLVTENQGGARWVHDRLLPDIIRNSRQHGFTVYAQSNGTFFLQTSDDTGCRRCYGYIDELLVLARFIQSDTSVPTIDPDATERLSGSNQAP